MICPRCNHDLIDGESHEEDTPSVRTHRLQRCFDLLKADLDSQSGLVSGSAKADEKTIKELLKQVAELESQVEARDDQLTVAADELEDVNQAMGKKKK